jgi:hypothetical protein
MKTSDSCKQFTCKLRIVSPQAYSPRASKQNQPVENLIKCLIIYSSEESEEMINQND